MNSNRYNNNYHNRAHSFNKISTFKKLIGCFLFLPNLLNSQEFLNIFNNDDSDFGTKVFQKNDSKILIGGGLSLQNSDLSSVLYHANDNGDFEKINILQNYDNENTYISDIIELNKKDTLILSNSFRSNLKFYLTNYNNKIKWSYSISNNKLNSIGKSMIKKNNSEIIIGGYTSNLDSEDILISILNIDNQNDLLLKENLIFGSSFKQKLNSLIKINESLFFTGTLKINNTKKILIGSLDNNYNILWTKFDKIGNKEGIFINKINDHLFIICGNYNNPFSNKKEIVFSKVHINGTIIWIKSIENIGDSSCYSILTYQNYIYLGTSIINSIKNNSKAAIIKTDENGEFIWGKLIKNKKGFGKINSMIISNDKKLLITGSQKKSLNKLELLFAKISLNNSSIGCHLDNFYPIIKNISDFELKDIKMHKKTPITFKKKNIIKFGSYIFESNSSCIFTIPNSLYKSNKISIHYWLILISAIVSIILSILTYIICKNKNKYCKKRNKFKNKYETINESPNIELINISKPNRLSIKKTKETKARLSLKIKTDALKLIDRISNKMTPKTPQQKKVTFNLNNDKKEKKNNLKGFPNINYIDKYNNDAGYHSDPTNITRNRNVSETSFLGIGKTTPPPPNQRKRKKSVPAYDSDIDELSLLTNNDKLTDHSEITNNKLIDHSESEKFIYESHSENNTLP